MVLSDAHCALLTTLAGGSAMGKSIRIITERGYYATRGGRLVFIELIEDAGSDFTVRAIGYRVSGTTTATVKIWRVWSADGKVALEEDPEWDIIKAI